MALDVRTWLLSFFCGEADTVMRKLWDRAAHLTSLEKREREAGVG